MLTQEHGGYPEGPRQVGEMGQDEPCEIQQGLMQSPALGKK